MWFKYFFSSKWCVCVFSRCGFKSHRSGSWMLFCCGSNTPWRWCFGGAACASIDMNRNSVSSLSQTESLAVHSQDVVQDVRTDLMVNRGANPLVLKRGGEQMITGPSVEKDYSWQSESPDHGSDGRWSRFGYEIAERFAVDRPKQVRCVVWSESSNSYRRLSQQ